MKLPAAFLGLFLGSLIVASAQEGESAKVVAEVSRNLGGYKSLEHVYEPKDGAEFQVKAWLSDGVLRRIKASQTGDGGVLTRDFYYNAEGELKHAHATLADEAKDGKPASTVEEKFDFNDGALILYVGPDKKPVAKEDKNFAGMETALTAMSDDLIERIEGSTAYAGVMGEEDGPKAPVGTVFGAGYSDGTFAGTEQGDYLHLDLKQADGSIETYFVLKPDAPLEQLLKDGDAAKGRKIRVHWTEKMQDIPEAGEATRMKLCDRIELLQ
ncbi:hypothetical protein OVA24_00600 [Luteolibacter sp. SL250]|uniref:hypothetical protein n=1 Tax=Luteolibacter sp. SL250 TaxID=2995170 RepID=UPI0022700273|nr:hypothetical protein [Luteolibacter sp. SL250]WAC19875.1 hypothetical protein OVA24_00600 [Luteolibacter sp. SL250]